MVSLSQSSSLQQSIEFQPVVTIVNGIAKTTSKAIAEFFRKRHDNVMRDIRNRLPDMGEWGVLNFEETPYVDLQNGQTYTMFEMTKDGFTFVVQKFTGKEATAFQIAYINRFNEMEAALKGKTQNPTTTAHYHIADTIDELVNKGVASKRALYNRLYRRFNVVSYFDIPAAQCADVVAWLKAMDKQQPVFSLPDGQHFVVAKDGVPVYHRVLSPDCGNINRRAIKDPQLMLEHIRQVVGEFVGKQALPAPCLEMSKPNYIPQHQAQEIRTRMDRLIGLFHPFSPQFSDALGVIRVLRGYSADSGTVNKTYMALIPPLA